MKESDIATLIKATGQFALAYQYYTLLYAIQKYLFMFSRELSLKHSAKLKSKMNKAEFKFNNNLLLKKNAV